MNNLTTALVGVTLLALTSQAHAALITIDRSNPSKNAAGTTNAGQSFTPGVNDGAVGSPATVYLQSIMFWTGGVNGETTSAPLYLKIFTGLTNGPPPEGTGLVGSSTNALARTTYGEQMLYTFDNLELDYGALYYAIAGPNANDNSFAAQPRQFGSDDYSGGTFWHCNFCSPANPATSGSFSNNTNLDARFIITLSDTPVEANPVPEPGSLMLLGSGILLGARRWRSRSRQAGRPASTDPQAA